MTDHHTIGTVRIAYEVAGTEGPAVVLLSPMTSHRRCWAAQVAALRPHCRVLTLDHRGIGDSPCAPEALRDLTIAQMAADALSVIDAVGWETVHIVGMSMGGAVAQELALLAGDRVESLSLIATAAKYPSLPRRGVWHFMWHCLGLMLRWRWLSARHLVALLHAPRWRRGRSDRALADHWGPPATLRVLLAQAKAVGRHDTRDRLAQLSAPAQVIATGPQDAFIDAAPQAALCDAIPGARLVPFVEAGHAVTVEAAEGVNAALAALILAEDVG